ncbi:MAG: zf-HC2 domain-containing protein [Actinobacteria bacterium]|nr:zf-HC2 domain-containing protein [Actinomycetota bacterium]
MTCDEVRELLPEHLLGTLEGEQDINVRRHLRGCAGCRAEMQALGEGLTTFARAAHDRRPPTELRDRVLTVLEEEWRDTPVEAPRGRRLTLLAAAAAAILLVVSAGWGVAQTRRANEFAAGARSYQTILHVLGGRDFRIGTLRPSGVQHVEGSLVLYDAHTDQSWGLAILRVPGMSGDGFQATLWTRDGTRIPFPSITLDAQGEGSAWIVTNADLRSFTKLTLSSPDGTLLASAEIRTA